MKNNSHVATVITNKKMTIPQLDDKQILEHLKSQINPFFGEYYAFYSSWYGGVVTNPCLMLLPIDDHMVHRGDGVFEAMKAEGRCVYLMDEHLDRLYRSAEKIALRPPMTQEEMKAIILETLQIANQSEVIIRVFLSRGPGNFSVNPYDSVKPQLYVVITHLKAPADEKIENGTIIGKSAIPSKSAAMAQVKSCNYLTNVLMKKEAVDRNLDFVIGVDEQGFVTESFTENILVVDSTGTLVHPPFDNILRGTTLVRTCELAREHGIPTQVKTLTLEEIRLAREVMMTGTTLNVLPVVAFEGHQIGDGKPGPLVRQLRALMIADIQNGIKGTPY